jgi:hypothetical protein
MSFGGERYQWVGEGLRGRVDKWSRWNRGRVESRGGKRPVGKGPLTICHFIGGMNSYLGE